MAKRFWVPMWGALILAAGFLGCMVPGLDRAEPPQSKEELGEMMVAYMEEKYEEKFTLHWVGVGGFGAVAPQATMYSESHPDDLVKVYYFSDVKRHPIQDDYPGVLIADSVRGRAEEILRRHAPNSQLGSIKVVDMTFDYRLGKDATYEEYLKYTDYGSLDIDTYVEDPGEETREALATALGEDFCRIGISCRINVNFIFPEMAAQLPETPAKEISKHSWYKIRGAVRISLPDGDKPLEIQDIRWY